jgi:hypothetical protein
MTFHPILGGGGGGGITPPAGDIGGTTAAPTVVSTHLSSALPVNQGGTGDESLTAYALLAGGTTTTGALQSLAGLGSGATQYLQSGGAAALPTFAGLTAGSTSTAGILQLDGTAGDIAAIGTQAAGSVGKSADAGHVHSAFSAVALGGAVVTLTDGSSISVNAANGSHFVLTFTASGHTMAAPSNPVAGQRIVFELIQSSSGSDSLSWASGTSGYNFGSAGAPTLTTAANKRDLVGFVYSGSETEWLYLGVALDF